MNPSQIRALRERLKLSPDEFAGKIGFTGKNRRISVWRWESGHRKPSKQAIILMRELASRSMATVRESLASERRPVSPCASLPRFRV